MSTKGKAFKNIQISEKTSGEDHYIRPLTKAEVRARIDWYSEMVPLFQSNEKWIKWALKRLDELKALLVGTHSVRNGKAI
jgi:hypothetical protein